MGMKRRLFLSKTATRGARMTEVPSMKDALRQAEIDSNCDDTPDEGTLYDVLALVGRIRVRRTAVDVGMEYPEGETSRDE